MQNAYALKQKEDQQKKAVAAISEMVKVYYEHKLEEALEPHVRERKAEAAKKKKEVKELEKKMGLSAEEIEKREAARKEKEEIERKKMEKKIEKERKAREA